MNIYTSVKTFLLITTGTLLCPGSNLLANSYPTCTNNTITLPGANGAEIWSCVAALAPGSGTNKSGLDATGNNAQISPPDSTNKLTVEKSASTSSEAMRKEIERVLENPVNKEKRKFLRNYSIGLQYSSNRRDDGLRDTRSRTVTVPVSVELSLSDKTNMAVTLPVTHKENESVASPGAQNTNTAGAGDINVNASHSLISETDRRPGLSLRFGVGVPTGDIEDPRESNNLSLGSGFWSGSVGATISKRFDPATVFASVGYQHALKDTQFGLEIQPGDSFEYSYGLGLSLNNSLSISGQISGSIHRNTSVDGETIDGSNSEPIEFVSSSVLRLSKKSRLESNLAFGLNQDASDARFGLTLIKDF